MEKNEAMKIIFVSWIRYQQRSECLAKHLGAKIHFFYFGKHGKMLQVPVRYLVQALKTWSVLRRECPNVIFVQNPPIFCVLTIFLYTKYYHAQYIIDSHTGSFLSWKWRWSLGLHRLFSRKALTTIVHNKSQEEILKSWGCHYYVISYIPDEYQRGEHFAFDGQFKSAVISSFSEDEPLDVLFEAIHRLPDVNFFLTGDSSRIALRLLAKKPGNCFLTGYMPYKQYLSLLESVDVIIVLTTRDNTLLAGAFEGVSIGKPLIVSDWPILRNYFSLGTVHVPNTVKGICEGVRFVQSNYCAMKQGIMSLQDQLQKEWEEKFEQLKQLLIKNEFN